jgi:hypothetical protein
VARIRKQMTKRARSMGDPLWWKSVALKWA